MGPWLDKPVICIDLGGLRIKGMLIDNGDIIASSHHRVRYIGEGLIDGKDYILKSNAIIKELISKVASKDVCLAVTSQRASIVGWDGELNIITPIYTWRHKAGGSVLSEVREKHELGPFELFLQPGSGILRVKYILENHGGIEFVGGIESLFIYSLFKAHLTSYSLAYAFGSLDPFELSWIEDLLDILDISTDKLPNIVGEKLSDISTSWNGVNLILGSLVADQSASLIGNGCLKNDYCKISMGTGCFIDVFTGENFIGDPLHGVNPMLIFVHNGKPLYMAEYFIYHWGDILDWLSQIHPNLSDAYYYNGIASLPRCIPSRDYLTTEYKHAVDGINIYGLDNNHKLVDIVAGILYSLIYLVWRGVNILSNLSSINYLYLDGGWSMDTELSNLLASSLGRKVLLRRNRYSASMIGSSALAVAESIEELIKYVDELNPVEDVIKPKVIEGYGEYVELMDRLLEKLSQASA